MRSRIQALSGGWFLAALICAPAWSAMPPQPGTINYIGGRPGAWRVGVPKARAMVEVAEIRPENNVRINAQCATTRLLKPGLYDIDADRGRTWRRPTWTPREGMSPAGDGVAVGMAQVGIGTPGSGLYVHSRRRNFLRSIRMGLLLTMVGV
jgi:hypothetical protein